MLWMRCPKCRGEVGIPDEAVDVVKCPGCHQVLLARDSDSQAVWKAAAPAPEWMGPAGGVSVIIGVLGFIASAYVEYSAEGAKVNYFIVALSGVMNPLFFIGFPLGLYWLDRSGAFDETEASHSKSHAPPAETKQKKDDSSLGCGCLIIVIGLISAFFNIWG